MFCPKCGKDIPDKSKFCFGCGANLKETLVDFGTILDEDTRPPEDFTLDDGATLLGTAQSIQNRSRYEILATLGKGGMGTIYKAKDNKLDRIVAIKRLLPAFSGNQQAFSRFMSEAKSLASLSHPNIVQVYDIGEDDEGHFIIMEYVEGGSLKDLIKHKGRLEEDEVRRIIIDVCKGVAQAHKKNIIHRDIKPANILIQDAGSMMQAKLTDFGIAQMTDGDEMTRTGIAMGTPVYMAPEQQADAKHVDRRADIYSLGATLYEMLTGETPRVVRLRDIPSGMRDVVEKCLEKVPGDRYGDVEELIGSINSLKSSSSTIISPQDKVLDFEPEMVLIEGEEFKMGDVFGDGEDDERPVHTVRLDDFYIGKYPVTFDEYDAYCEATRTEKPRGDEGWGRGRRPVINVSWEDAQGYLEWLSEQTGKGYRLPTEAEWEYAARSGGRREKYAGTIDEAELKDYAWYADNSGSKTHPVGQKKPNGLGLYDMSGNVWEWCSDCYRGDYYGQSPKDNPKGPGSGGFLLGRSLWIDGNYELRGGSWYGDPRYVRASNRSGDDPGSRGGSGGFRCSRTP